MRMTKYILMMTEHYKDTSNKDCEFTSFVDIGDTEYDIIKKAGNFICKNYESRYILEVHKEIRPIWEFTQYSFLHKTKIIYKVGLKNTDWGDGINIVFYIIRTDGSDYEKHNRFCK